MTDLDKLIAAVERGSYTKEMAHCLPYPNSKGGTALLAFDGSLDAAKALHESLLGEAHWSVAEDDDYGFCGKVYLRQWFHDHSDVAARAWLLAILKAYRSQQ